MDLDTLTSFIRMAKLGSLSQAAEDLFLSPSSLASRIKGLEQELGQELFNLRGRTLQLSAMGKQFLPYAEKFCQMAEEMQQEITVKARETSGSFSIAATPVISTYILPHILNRFNACYPSIEVEVVSCEDYKIHDYVLRGMIDLGMIQNDERHETLNYRPWFSDEDVLIVAASHEWANRAQVFADELPSQPMIAFERHSSIWKKQMEWMESQGVTPWISMELVHMETIKEILSHGTGFSFLPLQGVREELKQGVFRVVQLANAPKWKRDTYAVTPAKRKNSDKINALIEFVIQEGLDYLAALKVIS